MTKRRHRIATKGLKRLP